MDFRGGRPLPQRPQEKADRLRPGWRRPQPSPDEGAPSVFPKAAYLQPYYLLYDGRRLLYGRNRSAQPYYPQ